MRAKLRSVVRAVTGAEPTAGPDLALASGCAAVRGGGRVWILLEHEPVDALGPALLALDAAAAWEDAVLLVPDPHRGTGAAGATGAEVVSLRLAGFSDPPALLPVGDPAAGPVPPPVAPGEPDGRRLGDAVRAAGESEPLDLEGFLGALDRRSAEAVGALLAEVERRHPEVVVEPSRDGVVLSLDGLEVARIDAAPEGATFEVGVGIHDQDARRQVVGWRLVDAPSLADDLADLAHAVRTVGRHRVGQAPHPLRRLQPSRRLRARVVESPALAGLPGAALAPVDDPLPARGVRRDRPAVAVGGEEVVVCSTGIDLGLVPTAVHAWLRASRPDRWRRLVVAVPERDAHPATERLLARVRPEAGATLAPVPAGWETALDSSSC